MLSLLLAVFLTPSLGAEPRANIVPDPTLDFAGVARFLPPEGWRLMRTEGADPSLRLARGGSAIRVRLFGGRGSRYFRPHDFLGSAEATALGAPAEKLGQDTVAGLRVWFYRRGILVTKRYPPITDPRPEDLAMEEFCILPVGNRFLVLSWAPERSAPEYLEDSGESTWRRFLADFFLAKR